jgi:hypothetical protein
MRERPKRVVIVLHSQAELLQVVLALRLPSRFAGGLHGGNQQRDQDADDGDDDEQLDQRKARARS